MRFFFTAVFALLSLSANANLIQFQESDFQRYGDNQPNDYGVRVVDQQNGMGQVLELTGNTWAQLPFDITITDKTRLTFEFMTNDLGEIQGIGFDDDSSISSRSTFQLAGVQTNFGIQSTRIDNLLLGEWYRVEIRFSDYANLIGQTFDRFVFVNDEDRRGETSTSFFRNIAVDVPAPTGLVLLLTVGGIAFFARRK